MKKILTTLILGVSVLSSSYADVGERRTTTTTTTPTTRERTSTSYNFKSPTLFGDDETTVDIFGTYSAVDGNGAYDDGFGGGIGVNKFFRRYFGVGLEGYFWDGATNGDVISSVAGSIIARYPIEQFHVAPYLLGGIGGSFNGVDQFNVLGGGGLDVRITRNIGVFSDGRYVWTDKTNDYGLIRAGLRFAF
jgi:hypothetical protein